MAIDSILRAAGVAGIADAMGNIDLGKMAKEAVDSKIKEMGKANIIVAGKTGVGKSTLINAVLEGDLATTGVGKPITQQIQKYTKEGVPVGIFDTKGLEVKDYKTILDDLSAFVKTTNSNQDASEHIHVAWICIAEGSRRVEEAEVLLAKQLSEHMPVIVVITTATSDNGFKDVVKREFPFAANVIRVNSVPTTLDGEDGFVIPTRGLTELVNLTIDVIPEGQRKAFAAAQKVSLDLKISQAHKAVAISALTAGGIGATPIPFSDAIGIIPVQIGMLASISAAFGLKIDQAFLSSLVAGTFTATAGSMAGKALVGALLKMIPGVGSVAGGAISGGVAAALTTAFGESYIAVLTTLLKDSPDRELSAEEVAKAFKAKLG
jgi:uncharacterized protein (DUF697 family)/dephospho-CoA kinase